MMNNQGVPTVEKSEGNPTMPEFANEAAEASNQYYRKAVRAESKLADGVKRLLSPEILVKAGILEGLEAFELTGIPYTPADLYVLIDGIQDILYGVLHKELDVEERVTSGLRGGAKVAVAAIPYLPAAGIDPALDALIPTSRDEREKT